jgi:hypothetical protein
MMIIMLLMTILSVILRTFRRHFNFNVRFLWLVHAPKRADLAELLVMEPKIHRNLHHDVARLRKRR